MLACAICCEHGDIHGCASEDFGITWKKAKMRFFGYVLRASPADPMNQVSFHVDNLRPRPVRSRRSGRPKLDWTLDSCRDAFEIMNGPGGRVSCDQYRTFATSQRSSDFERTTFQLKARTAWASRGKARGYTVLGVFCSCFASSHAVCYILCILYTIVRRELSCPHWKNGSFHSDSQHCCHNLGR